MKALIEDASSFDVAISAAEIVGARGKILKTDIYRALDEGGEREGFAFVAVGAGFADKIKLVIATDGACEKFLGFKVLASNETPGFGSKIKEDYFSDQFIGAPAGQIVMLKAGEAEVINSEIIAISGATVSSEAVIGIFNTYIGAVKEKLNAEGLISDGK